MIWAHLLCWNEENILPWSLRHYTSMCERVIVHDAFSTDRSREICAEYRAEVVDWHCPKLDDLKAKKVKEDAVMVCEADWCIVVDADELIYFPQGAFNTLAAYDAAEVAVVKPRGFEMFSDTPPEGDMQIYDYIKQGCPDPKWANKPALVAPHRIKSILFGAGCHQAWATLKNGKKWEDEQTVTTPETYLLHCHHVWGLERSTKRYERQRSRLSESNVQRRFGNFEPADKHAKDKRAMILKGLKQVIA